MKRLLPVTLGAGLLLAGGHAQALAPACETYLRAAEKSASQPARHMVTETGGIKLELVSVDGRVYTRFDGGKWQQAKGNGDPVAMEKQFLAAIRAGKYPMTGCRRVGSEAIEGKPVTVYAYTLSVPGAPAGETLAYIGADGLVHGQKSSEAVVRHRYTGVTAPKL